MAIEQGLPVPSIWGIDASMAGRPIVRGEFIINSITNNQIVGTSNFRGTQLPFNGTWDKKSNQITFNTPFATFSGALSLYEDPTIGIRHYILTGPFLMKAPSLQAGEYGNWLATTDVSYSQLSANEQISQNANALPPVGVFLTSDILYQSNRVP